MTDYEITLEKYTAVVKRAVEIYRELLAKPKNRGEDPLRKCAETAARSVHLQSVFLLETAHLGTQTRPPDRNKYELLAHQLEQSNETIVDVVMAIARIEDEGKDDVAQRVEGLIQYAYIDFSTRAMFC